MCTSLARLYAPSSNSERHFIDPTSTPTLSDDVLPALLRQVSGQIVAMDVREGLNSALACVRLSVHTSDPIVLKSIHLVVTRVIQLGKQNLSRLNYPDLVQLLRLFVQVGAYIRQVGVQQSCGRVW